MYIIELTLKTTPVPLSVQRKLPEDAQAVYHQILGLLRTNSNQILELTCDRQPEKKLAVFSGEIVAVQIYEKSSTAASGRPPGFLSVAE